MQQHTPAALRNAVAIAEFWDASAHRAALAYDHEDRRTLGGRTR